jgi:hypothetical protein
MAQNIIPTVVSRFITLSEVRYDPIVQDGPIIRREDIVNGAVEIFRGLAGRGNGHSGDPDGGCETGDVRARIKKEFYRIKKNGSSYVSHQEARIVGCRDDKGIDGFVGTEDTRIRTPAVGYLKRPVAYHSLVAAQHESEPQRKQWCKCPFHHQGSLTEITQKNRVRKRSLVDVSAIPIFVNIPETAANSPVGKQSRLRVRLLN